MGFGKRIGIVLVVGILIMLVGSGARHEVSAQAVPGLWTKYAENPVLLGSGEEDSWDGAWVLDPSVMLDGLTYKMWYTGCAISGPPCRLGYATSSNGTDWTKFGDNPVLSEGPAGSWDEKGARYASVLLDGGVYKMWYTGCDASIVNRIGYATSPNGTDWTKHENNPVLDVGASGSWDDGHLLYLTVIKEAGTYKMWYTGWKSGGATQIGYATSPNGTDWTKHENNPVLTWGPSESWDDVGVYAASVLLDNGTYRLWYSGYDGAEYQTGYATSADGISWIKYPANPVITEGPEGTFDADSADYPCVILDGNTYKMWYSGWIDEEIVTIGYAYAASLSKHIYLPLILKNY